MRRDQRAPVLLLRSFIDDDLQGREDRKWFRSADTFEEVLTDQLWLFGPVLAIGQPGEPIPRAGAAREYVSHERWKERVHALANDASLIVLVAGQTPGIAWELENAGRMGNLQKTVLVLPNGSESESLQRYALLRQGITDTSVTARLPVALPPRTLALLLRDVPVALIAPSRAARFYDEAIGLAARAVLGVTWNTSRIGSHHVRGIAPATGPDPVRVRAARQGTINKR
jgi:hypothetical protein